MPNAGDFVLSSCQATLFTPEAEVSGARFLSQILSRWSNRFDSEPTVIPLPEGVPKEIPKILLESRDHNWRCEVASGRVNIFWRQTKSESQSISLGEFCRIVEPMLTEYKVFVSSPVRRVAAVVNRYVRHDRPGLYLAQHFCRDKWLAAPFNRPENFELHAHKQFSLMEGITVNSWVRNKTGKITGTDQPIVIVEQDLNTPAEDIGRDYDDATIHRFFEAGAVEFDAILKLYYPLDPDEERR